MNFFKDLEKSCKESIIRHMENVYTWGSVLPRSTELYGILRKIVTVTLLCYYNKVFIYAYNKSAGPIGSPKEY